MKNKYFKVQPMNLPQGLTFNTKVPRYKGSDSLSMLSPAELSLWLGDRSMHYQGWDGRIIVYIRYFENFLIKIGVRDTRIASPLRLDKLMEYSPTINFLISLDPKYIMMTNILTGRVHLHEYEGD